jgi:hypothetical protein
MRRLQNSVKFSSSSKTGLRRYLQIAKRLVQPQQVQGPRLRGENR